VWLPLQIDEVYSELSAEPVNAASLGQVYRGRLRATGEEVAVKVQRPAIADSIAMDMLLLRRLMAAADANIPQVTGQELHVVMRCGDETVLMICHL